MKTISKIFWLIVIAAILYAGFFVYEKRQNKNNPAPEPVSNLQTYTDKNLNFEIKYPNDFSKDTTGQAPIEQGNMQYNFGLPVTDPAVTLNLSADNYKNTGFKLAYFSVTEYPDLKITGNAIPRAPMNIDGRIFYRYEWVDNAMGGERGVGYVYFGNYGKKLVMMSAFLNYRDERGFKDTSPLYLEDSAIRDILSKFDTIAQTFKSL